MLQRTIWSQRVRQRTFENVARTHRCDGSLLDGEHHASQSDRAPWRRSMDAEIIDWSMIACHMCGARLPLIDKWNSPLRSPYSFLTALTGRYKRTSTATTNVITALSTWGGRILFLFTVPVLSSVAGFLPTYRNLGFLPRLLSPQVHT